MTDIKRRKRPSVSEHLFDYPGMTETLRRNLFYILLAVVMGTVNSVVTGGAAWTGFIIRLGLNAFALGALSAIPVAANAIQLLISYLFEKTGKRRELFLYIGIIGRAAWIIAGLIPLFFPIPGDIMRVITLVFIVAVCACSNAVISVGFFSLVADILPMRMRGRYFGTRASVSLAVAVISGLLISQLIDRTSAFTGYIIALILAGIFGALDIVCYLRVEWPEMQRPEKSRVSLKEMVMTVLRDRQFRYITLMMTYYAFGVYIAAPFWNMYMIEVIGMSYTQITLLNQVLPNIIAIFIISWWGKKADEFGNKPVFQTTGFIIMFYPLLWLFTGPGVFWMLVPLNIITGLVTNAFDLSAQNTYLNASPSHNRSMYISVYIAVTQLVGTATASMLGGWLLQNVTPHLEALNLSLAGFKMTRYHYLFALSGILRVSMIVFLLPRLKEEGCATAGAMVRETVRGTRLSITRRYAMQKNALQRRRLRKLLDRHEMNEKNDKKDSINGG